MRWIIKLFPYTIFVTYSNKISFGQKLTKWSIILEDREVNERLKFDFLLLTSSHFENGRTWRINTLIYIRADASTMPYCYHARIFLWTDSSAQRPADVKYTVIYHVHSQSGIKFSQNQAPNKLTVNWDLLDVLVSTLSVPLQCLSSLQLPLISHMHVFLSCLDVSRPIARIDSVILVVLEALTLEVLFPRIKSGKNSTSNLQKNVKSNLNNLDKIKNSWYNLNLKLKTKSVLAHH